ncbi:GIY-YIG nuclease family protein [Salibacteraceae bacterium]|jgi:putative endonuclease|nr:GIY-YIG nuclease family protein [Salibacteraceae bacterium]
MSYFIYILHSKEYNRLYKGMTEDLLARLKQHNAGKVKSTKAFIPWEIIHSESFDSSEKARAREKYFKTDNALQTVPLAFLHGVQYF